jgi:MoxR-like ATPase
MLPLAMTSLLRASTDFRAALADASRGLVDREALVDLIALAAVAGEHVLVVGPPGTAKSEAARRVARAFGGTYFEYLLGRFTEPSEIFGPVDLRKLREGIVETEVAGMLPEADVAFLDEVFRGSTAILNTLLGILNERTFRRGHTRMTCPLRVCVAAANEVPADEGLAAFGDRFLLQTFLESVPDARLEDLLEGGARLAHESSPKTASLADLDALAAAARASDLAPVRPLLAHAVRLLRKNGIGLSDRRVVKIQKLVAAAAAIAGRAAPTEADLWTLVPAVPSRDGQAAAREVLREILAKAENAALAAAALEASLGPLARAQRIVNVGESLLSTRPGGDDDRAVESWRLKLEGVAREIDAGFSARSIPADVASLRARIVAEAVAPRPEDGGPSTKPAGAEA